MASLLLGRAMRVGVLLLGLVALAASTARAQGPSFRNVHAGNVFKSWITADGSQTWTAEDGGRVRHRDEFGNWTFQDVDGGTDPIKDMLLSIQFLDDGDNGWAVSMNGWIARTLQGGAPWSHRYQFSFTQPPEELWDVWFTDINHGWLVGRHNVYRTTNGGLDPANWSPVLLLDKQGQPILFQYPQDDNWFFYGIDVQLASKVANPPQGQNVVGLLCASPGVVFRNIDADGQVWQIVYDVRQDLCGTSEQPRCMSGWCNNPSAPGIPLYDVSISRNPTNPLALVVGGGSHCGLMLSTEDYGVTWQSERHECCLSSLQTCPDCNGDSNYDPSTPIHHHKKPEELYSVAIWDEDNTAIASGYAGQHMRRDAGGVWHDDSIHTTNPVANPQGITVPLYGVAADEGSASNGKGIISGAGGYLRFTQNGGSTWSNQDHPDFPSPTASPYRLQDVHFVTQSIGFVAGQWYRIAKTTDGGHTWDHVSPNPQQGAGNLNAITFNADGSLGVAVGEAPNSSGPKILWTDSPLTSLGENWDVPLNIIEDPGTNSTDQDLRAVAWAGGQSFWAAGDAGLIYQSSDGGVQWQQYLPPYPLWSTFAIEGVAFRDVNTGIFVGSVNNVGAAFLYSDNSGTIAWEDIKPTLTGLNVWRIHGVAIDASANKAYAVATAFDPSGNEFGVLLTKDLTTPTSEFIATGVQVSPCLVGDELTLTRTLNAVTVAPGGVVWYGGECGRVFSYEGTLPPTTHKSLTDAHIRGISFPTAGVGIFAGLSQGRTGWAISRYD